mgnify:CR=1 FL=1
MMKSGKPWGTPLFTLALVRATVACVAGLPSGVIVMVSGALWGGASLAAMSLRVAVPFFSMMTGAALTPLGKPFAATVSLPL